MAQPIEGDAYKMRRYRIEWRHDLTTHWVILTHADTHDEALATVRREHKKHGGQVRAVMQHAISAMGLGAEHRPMTAGAM